MSTALPVIGLSTYRELASYGVWHQRTDLLSAEYADAVSQAGGVPVLLPPADPAHADVVVSRIDGLVISGGADVDPASYGQQPHDRTANWRSDRDAWELALLDAAERIGLPVLGVCRGMQVMAVRAGGVLDQHVPDLVGHETHSPGGPEYGTITVATVDGSRIAGLLGPEVEVNCHHHQSVRTHPGFVASAHAADGVLEAMEAPGDRFCLGVQWHPETAADAGLLTGLLAAASHFTPSRR
ncbi:gamma-glutamyl-gamma-aminobutyrate hydrolase family protein [Nocardioides sp. GXZ039]|uniref:gamma-glutamyl-gamma-aminobutyrate hydrolase family protein n=1 Tax=Nocardioides sp. GXZ039 TaxID=3136018 RepID=UPI0030F3A6C9